MVSAFGLTSENRDCLNAMLEGCFWNACAIDVPTGIGAAAVEVVGTSFRRQGVGEAYPVLLVCSMVSRVAASFKVDGRVRLLDLNDLNAALHEFSFKEIDDWDIVDPSQPTWVQWEENASVDVKLRNAKASHLLEMWQDDSPFQTLNLAIWFDELNLLDAELNPLTIDDLNAAMERGAEVSSHGWLRTGVIPKFTIADLVGIISS